MKIGKIEIDLWSIPGVTGSGPPAVNTERMIEVPLGYWFINNYSPIIEIGAVTPYFYNITHEVVDPNDSWVGCVKKNADQIDYTNLNVLSISTVEHISHGEYGQPSTPDGAINALKRMMQANKWLITWAAGYHKNLDNYVEDNVKSVKLLRKEFSIWESVPSLKTVQYDYPFPYGNAVYVVTNCSELLA